MKGSRRFAISGFLSENAPCMHPDTYMISSIGGDGGQTISSSKGETFRVAQSEDIRSHLDILDVTEYGARAAGWAANIKNFHLPEAILFFRNNKFLYAGKTGGVRRPNLAKAFGGANLKWAGFEFDLPLKELKDTSGLELRFFAIWNNGHASELIYPNDYKWGKEHNIVH